VAPEHPIWVKFARAMAPMMAMPSQLMAKLVDEMADPPRRRFCPRPPTPISP
jgi:hypothetical protein